MLQEEQERQRKLEALSERQRRSYHRRLERGDEAGAQLILDKALFDDDSETWSDLDDLDDSDMEDEDINLSEKEE